MKHESTINRAITTMICAPQRRYTAAQLRKVIKQCNSSLNDNELSQAVEELKTHSKIECLQVGKRKAYYQYKGIL